MPNRRKDDDPGKPKLTPGERFLNWAKALGIIIPLFGAGWASNTETAKAVLQGEASTERWQPVQMDCPLVSCPKCPDITLSCPEISIDSHIDEDHR